MPKPFIRTAFALGVLLAMASGGVQPLAAAPEARETVVFIRHGEKPPLGLGQLTCQGLNRALALPGVIATAFGRPNVIFAPDPAKSKDDSGLPYNYVRPLATIEPTAIAFGMPVDASIGFANLEALRRRLNAPAFHAALVLVAWEHANIVKIARRLMADNGGNPASVPEWEGSDFDSIYIVRILRNDGHVTATFERRHEGLDGEPTACPVRPPPG
jgi:hypothetical protein